MGKHRREKPAHRPGPGHDGGGGESEDGGVAAVDQDGRLAARGATARPPGDRHYRWGATDSGFGGDVGTCGGGRTCHVASSPNPNSYNGERQRSEMNTETHCTVY